MKIFEQDSYLKAREYIFTQGRELERALYNHHFENGLVADVLSALSAYQNPDGGFGRALEPDLRAPASSVIATSQALTILREIKASREEPMVKNAITYLLSAYDPEKGVWPIIPRETDQWPHAWWWDYEDTEKNFRGFLLNPRAAVIGHLHHYADLVDQDFLSALTELVLDALETLDDVLDMHEIHCCVGLAEASGLPKPARRRLLDYLEGSVSRVVVLDRERWTEYCLKPLDIAPTPDALLVNLLEQEVLEAHLDFWIDNQLPDGTWALGWSWENRNPEAWKQAEREWKGYDTLNKLKTLRAFARVESL